MYTSPHNHVSQCMYYCVSAGMTYSLILDDICYCTWKIDDQLVADSASEDKCTRECAGKHPYHSDSANKDVGCGGSSAIWVYNKGWSLLLATLTVILLLIHHSTTYKVS